MEKTDTICVFFPHCLRLFTFTTYLYYKHDKRAALNYCDDSNDQLNEILD